LSLEKLTKTKGGDHPETIICMNNVGAALGSLNRHEESLALFQITLEKVSIVFGEDDSRTLQTMGGVAGQLSYFKRHDEARDLEEKVFEKRSRIQGDEHPDTVKALYYLVTTQYNAGRYDEAHQNDSRCLLLARKIGAEETAAGCTKLLSFLDDRKKYNDVTSTDEQRRLLAKIITRKNQADAKAEVARLKAATAQSPTKEPSVDDLMAQWGFDDDDGGGKKKSSNATSNGGGSKQKKKKGKK
jgi:tetratricopeptide (TPR) repeat protein